jgi:hypothetical protein
MQAKGNTSDECEHMCEYLCVYKPVYLCILSLDTSWICHRPRHILAVAFSGKADGVLPTENATTLSWTGS